MTIKTETIAALTADIESKLTDVGRVRDALRESVSRAEDTLNALDETHEALDRAKSAIDELDRALDRVSEHV